MMHRVVPLLDKADILHIRILRSMHHMKKLLYTAFQRTCSGCNQLTHNSKLITDFLYSLAAVFSTTVAADAFG